MGVYRRRAVFALPLCSFLIHACLGRARLARPRAVSVSARCAAVEFASGDPSLERVYAFAKRERDPAFLQWGSGLRVKRVGAGEGGTTIFRVLVQELPPGQSLFIKLADESRVNAEVLPGEASEVTTLQREVEPPPPHDLQLHRSDPRLNVQKEDGSVCVDLHWSHADARLDEHADDVFFRVTYRYQGESPQTYCEDPLGGTRRRCGVALQNVVSELKWSYETICGLRPKRHVDFEVVAFNCDGHSAHRSVSAVTPPNAPSVITTLVTSPQSQESIAGFRPRAVVDWIPQHDELITGHAVYLGLRQISAMKLLCWMPLGHEFHRSGYLEVPIRHKNHTFSEDSLLLHAYMSEELVHQEQELLISTRVQGQLESPPISARLGDWLVVDEALKCLTSFDASFPSYVAHDSKLAWTQEEGMFG